MTTYNILTHAFSDNIRFAKSRTIISPDDGTYNVIAIPKYGFVKSVWLEIVTATDVEPDDFSIGWSGNGETAVAAGFMSQDIADPTVTGLKIAMKDTLVSFPGKYFSGASGLITFTFAAGSATTLGTYRIYADYTVIH